MTAPIRHLRAAVAAFLAVALGASAHRLGHGMTPSPTAVLLGFATLYLGGSAFARRERSLLSLAAFVGIGQLGLHLAFTSVEHEHMAPVMAGMTAFHVVAGLLLAVWLRVGEDLAWTLLVRLAGSVLVARRLLVAAPPVVAVAFPAPRALVGRALLLPVGRRGPPVSAALR